SAETGNRELRLGYQFEGLGYLRAARSLRPESKLVNGYLWSVLYSSAYIDAQDSPEAALTFLDEMSELQLYPDNGYGSWLRDRASASKAVADAYKAVANCTRAIERDPKDVAAWNDRGAAYDRAGDRDKALGDICQAIELDPNYASAWNNLGQHYSLLGN